MAGEALSKDGVVAKTFMGVYAVEYCKCSHYKYYLDITWHINQLILELGPLGQPACEGVLSGEPVVSEMFLNCSLLVIADTWYSSTATVAAAHMCRDK